MSSIYTGHAYSLLPLLALLPQPHGTAPPQRPPTSAPGHSLPHRANSGRGLASRSPGKASLRSPLPRPDLLAHPHLLVLDLADLPGQHLLPRGGAPTPSPAGPLGAASH